MNMPQVQMVPQNQMVLQVQMVPQNQMVPQVQMAPQNQMMPHASMQRGASGPSFSFQQNRRFQPNSFANVDMIRKFPLFEAFGDLDLDDLL